MHRRGANISRHIHFYLRVHRRHGWRGARGDSPARTTRDGDPAGGFNTHSRGSSLFGILELNKTPATHFRVTGVLVSND